MAGDVAYPGLVKFCLVSYLRTVKVAALISTVALTAGFAMPGGFDDNNGPTQGSPMLLRKTAFKMFMVTDAIALLFSMSSLFIYFVELMLCLLTHKHVFRMCCEFALLYYCNYSVILNSLWSISDVDFVLSICMQSNFLAKQAGKPRTMSKQMQGVTTPSLSDTNKSHPVPNSSAYKATKDRQTGKRKDFDRHGKQDKGNSG